MRAFQNDTGWLHWPSSTQDMTFFVIIASCKMQAMVLRTEKVVPDGSKMPGRPSQSKKVRQMQSIKQKFDIQITISSRAPHQPREPWRHIRLTNQWPKCVTRNRRCRTSGRVETCRNFDSIFGGVHVAVVESSRCFVGASSSHQE